MKSRILELGLVGLAVGLAYCSFGPDEYEGPFLDPAPVEDGGTTGGGSDDDGGSTGAGGSSGGSAGSGGSTNTGGSAGAGGGMGGSGGRGQAGSNGSGGRGPDAGMAMGPFFGSHSFKYPPDVKLPTGPQSSLDAATAAFYDKWKTAYVKEGCGGYYVFSNGGTGADVGDEVSEGHGYGMITTAIMAGHDPDAKKIFDGMYAFFRKFPSSHTPDLMGWTVNVGGGCKFPSTPSDSATDGDLDIAFSLLLADKLWGSAGAINYLAEAKKVIAAIMKFEVNPTTHLTNLGDWATATDYSTRPSDFMADHFHAFATAGGNAGAMAVVDAMFKVETAIQAGPSMATGLMPDFVVNTNTTPKPAAANFLEGAHDGDYDYNSCRNPWRIATHYIGWADARAKEALAKTNTWIRTATGGDPKKIHDGYKLNGTATSTGTDLSFEAPFGVAAMLGSDQAWLDAIWKDVVGQGVQGYYGDSIKMLCMIVMSGNWWEP